MARRRVHALLSLLGARHARGMSTTPAHHQPVLNALKQSRRIRATDPPCIVQMQQMLRGKDDVISLAQGIVHWTPPTRALDAAREAIDSPETSLYCADDGLPALRDALLRKLATKNGITQSDVMVTQGANQAYMNLVLTLLDAGDAALLYRPYYFNHLMALQMTGCAAELVLPQSKPDLQPDVSALRQESPPHSHTRTHAKPAATIRRLPTRLAAASHRLLAPTQELRARAADKERRQLKLVTIVNPGNPTGVMVPRETLAAISDLCAAYGVWLVVDNTYELFEYPAEEPHACIEGPHVLNLFSFSKAFGMMGWRVGYVAYAPSLGLDMLKAQDTIAICPAVLSQRVALAALDVGDGWVRERVDALAEQKSLVLDALAPLGPDAVRDERM